MANWQRIQGGWGTHFADIALADAWASDAKIRADAVRAATAAPWTEQRAGIVAAWGSLGKAYKAANIPPPSDPKFRNVLADWYGSNLQQIHGEDRARLFVGPMAATMVGGEFYRRSSTIWTRDLGRPRFTPDADLCMEPVRVCLSSLGDVTLSCMSTDDSCTAYGGLYTGCADPDTSNVYREHPCGPDRLTWQSFQWHDPPGMMGCAIQNANPPAVWSLDVLDALLDEWRARGGATGVIDVARAFVLTTNTANAIKAGLLPDEYRTSAFAIQADADQISRGNTTARQSTVTGIAAATAIIAAASGPYAPIVTAVGAAVAAIAAVWPVATGTAVDALGLPMVRADLSAAWLAGIIVAPDAQGRITLDVPAPDGGTYRSTSTLRPTTGVPVNARPNVTAQAALQGLAPPTLTIVGGATGSGSTSGGVPPWLVAAGIAALAFAASKGRR